MQTHPHATANEQPQELQHAHGAQQHQQREVGFIITASLSASAAAHTFNALTTWTFGSFAGRRRG